MRLLGEAGISAGAVLDTDELAKDVTFELGGIMQTMDHSVPLDPPLLSPLPGQRGAAAPRRHRLQPRQSAASARVARHHPELVPHEQKRLLKTGGRLIRHARYFTLQLAESYLTGPLFRQILRRVERLAWHPT